ncbi:hypothetical protein M885DRAFT_525433 [Pelagophyceae sp. CCMP2097]|nr:hypothetical protein M885DRAFT_525433 [Pelagophyceae sp. CCMP2097]
MPSYTVRATDKDTGEVRLMKVKAGTPMTEVVRQYAALTGIDEAECHFLVGGQPLKGNKPLDEQVSITTTTDDDEAEKAKDESCGQCSCLPTFGRRSEGFCADVLR